MDIKVTAPDGTVYRAKWHKSTPPTESDFAQLKSRIIGNQQKGVYKDPDTLLGYNRPKPQVPKPAPTPKPFKLIDEIKRKDKEDAVKDRINKQIRRQEKVLPGLMQEVKQEFANRKLQQEQGTVHGQFTPYDPSDGANAAYGATLPEHRDKTILTDQEALRRPFKAAQKAVGHGILGALAAGGIPQTTDPRVAEGIGTVAGVPEDAEMGMYAGLLSMLGPAAAGVKALKPLAKALKGPGKKAAANAIDNLDLRKGASLADALEALRGKVNPSRFPEVADEAKPKWVVKKAADDFVGKEYQATFQVHHDGKPVGGVAVTVHGDKVLVRDVQVLPEYQRQGVASALYDRLREEFPGYPIETFGDIRTEAGQKFRAAYDAKTKPRANFTPQEAAGYDAGEALDLAGMGRKRDVSPAASTKVKPPYVETAYGKALREGKVDEFLSSIKSPYYDPRGQILPIEAFTPGFKFRFFDDMNRATEWTVVERRGDTVVAKDETGAVREFRGGTRLQDSEAIIQPPTPEPAAPVPVATIKDALAGRKTAKIGRIILPDGEKYDAIVSPDNSNLGEYNLLLQNKEGGRSTFRMFYKHDTPVEEALRFFAHDYKEGKGLQYEVDVAPPRPTLPKTDKGTVIRYSDKEPPWKSELKAELKDRMQARFKGARQMARIQWINDALKADTQKWKPGDGVGWRVTKTQTNRGFAIVDVDHSDGMIKIRSVADTGLTTSGGNADKLADEWVHVADLVRDRKYDLAPSKIKTALSESTDTLAAKKAAVDAARKAQNAAMKRKGKQAGGFNPLLPEELDYFQAWAKHKGLEAASAVEDFLVHAKEVWGEEAVPYFRHHLSQLHPKPVEAKPVAGGDFGLATKFEPDASRPKSGISVEELAEQGRVLIAKDAKAPERIYQKAAKNQALAPEEIAVLAHRGKQIQNRSAEITQAMTDPNLSVVEKGELAREAAALEDEMGRILDGGTLAQKTFHQTGQALKAAYQPDYSTAAVIARAKTFNLGEELPAATRKQLESASTEINRLNTELAELRLQITKGIGAGIRSKDPVKARGALRDNILKDLGLLAKAKPVGGGMKSKQAGAIQMPETLQKRLQTNANRLAKIYLSEGADSLDGILSRFAEDLPELDSDTVLALLSQKYRTKLLESDVHKISVNRAFRQIQDAAQRKEQPVMQRFASESAEMFLATQRAMQASLDTSFAFIQGLPGGIASPSTWLKSWGGAFKPLVGGKKGYDFETARLQRETLYPRAVKAGVAFSDVNGPITAQEEGFMGNLIERMRAWANEDGKFRATVRNTIGLYPEAVGRSNEMYAAYLNRMRYDLFKSFTSGMVDDADAMRDAARLVNIITGRGDGKMAQALSNKHFALAFYAPRYMLSVAQNAAIPLLLPTFKTRAGKLNALKTWGKQAAVLYGSLEIAKQFGLEVDDDLRSTDFGTIKLPSGHTVNPFKKIAEPARIGTQLWQGKVSAEDNYRESSGWNNISILGQFLNYKFSPAARVIWDSLAGDRYDGDKTEPMALDEKTLKQLFTPIAHQQASRQEGDVASIIGQMAGLDVNAPGKKKVPKKPRPLKKPLPVFRP